MLPNSCKSFWIFVLILTSSILSVENKRTREFKFIKVTTIQNFANRDNVGQRILTISDSVLSCAIHLMQYGPFTCMEYYALQGICSSNNGGETVDSINTRMGIGWSFFNVQSIKTSKEECKLTNLGNEYNGRANVTIYGAQCQSWGATSPHAPNSNSVNALINNNECKMTDVGKEYRGNANVTLRGIRCQGWGINSPHIVDVNVYNVLGQEEDRAIYTTNYCRNPDDEPGGPWCYTMDPDSRWEYCNVPKCQCYS